MNFPPRSFAARIRQGLLALVLSAAGMLPADLRAGIELIPNDKFADDGTSWKFFADKGATAEMSVEKVDNEPALCVTVTATDEESEPSPENVVNVRVQRLFGEISADARYHVRFKAKAETDAGIVSFISPEKESARVLWRTVLKLDSGWKEFAFDITARDTADQCVFGFARLGGITNKYWFKDIVLTVD